MNDKYRDLARLNDLLDRHGGDLGTWPDAKAALWARELVLADPEARHALDEARGLDALLTAHAGELAANRTLVERTVAAVGAALPARHGETRLLVARLAASFLIAGVIGGAVAQTVKPLAAPADAELVLFDSLLYGPAEGEMQ